LIDVIHQASMQCAMCGCVTAGRVKTLHPAVHGGILAIRDKPEHMSAIEQHKIGTIDLVGGVLLRRLWAGRLGVQLRPQSAEGLRHHGQALSPKKMTHPCIAVWVPIP